MPKLGQCSRTEAFGLIRSGRVAVNGKTVKDPGSAVSSGSKITVDGKAAVKQKNRYIIFHKPAGCVTTCKDERSRKTVYDVMGGVGARVFPVGRLDKDSEGLLLFTNDTAFGDFLTDPANKIPRTYEVTVDGIVSDAGAGKMQRGLDIGRGEYSKPLSVKVLERGGGIGRLEITLVEGKNREVRRLCEAAGAPVLRLVRISFGPFRLGGLGIGKWKDADGRFCVDLYSRKGYHKK